MTRPDSKSPDNLQLDGDQATVCGCCKGTKTVLALDDTLRPCSRCAVAEFNAWCKSRSAKIAAMLNKAGGKP